MDAKLTQTIEEATDLVAAALPDCNREEVKKAFTNFATGKGKLYEGLGLTKEQLDFLYGEAYRKFQAGMNEEALGIFLLLDTFDPENEKYLMGKALCYQALKNYHLAIQSFHDLSGVISDDPRIQWHLFECFEGLEDLEAQVVHALACFMVCKKHEGKFPELEEMSLRSYINVSGQLEQKEKQG